MSNPTQHGENIASQIQDEDAYGYAGNLTLADIWLIIDNLHTHFLTNNEITKMLSNWMRELENIDSDLPL